MSLRTLYDEASLWMTPGGYEDGKLFSELPTDGSGDFTFSRGSNLAATRVGPTGLIEKGRENLWLQSTDLGTSPNATTSAANITGGQSGYDGSSNAWELESLSDGFYRRLYQSATQTGVITFSIYAKSANTDSLLIYNNQNGHRAWFDLSNGSLGNLNGAIDSSIEDIGGGWYRCSISLITSTASEFWICPTNGNNVASCDLGNSILLQSAQLEAGLVATDYIETGASTAQAGILEDMPRLDYSGSCPALLLEPQRSNFMIQSEYFDIAYNLINVGFDYNNSISPEGLQNAAKVIPTNGATLARVWKGPYGSGSQVASVFAKAGEYDSIYFAVFSGSVYKYAAYNLSNGSLISATADNYGIEDYGNGWYRVWVYLASSTSRYVNLSVGNSTDTIGNVGFEISANGTDGLYIYGYQVELDASYPTSYIPTYGSSVTRSWDANNASFVDIESEGTMFGEVEVVDTGAFGTPMALSINNATTNFVLIYKTDINKLSARIRFGGVDQCLIDSGTLTEGYHKFAFRYRENDCEFFVDGVSVGTDTSVSIPIGLNVIRQYIGGSINPFVGGTKQLAYFPTALTDTECIELTINGLKEDLITAYKTRATTLEAGAEDRLDTYLQQLEDFIIV